jgi:hypothetical protein
MAKPNKNSQPPIPPAVSSDANPPRTPLWETLAMAGAFVLLWVWFASHRAAQKANAELGVEWTVALLTALAVMAFITIRRVGRFKRALLESQQQAKHGPVMPWMPSGPNERN